MWEVGARHCPQTLSQNPLVFVNRVKIGAGAGLMGLCCEKDTADKHDHAFSAGDAKAGSKIVPAAPTVVETKPSLIDNPAPADNPVPVDYPAPADNPAPVESRALDVVFNFGTKRRLELAHGVYACFDPDSSGKVTKDAMVEQYGQEVASMFPFSQEGAYGPQTNEADTKYGAVTFRDWMCYLHLLKIEGMQLTVAHHC